MLGKLLVASFLAGMFVALPTFVFAAEIDSDNDGLNDWLEGWFGSDRGVAGSDGDGNNDFGKRTHSRGCANLRDEDAALLYKYMELGVPVEIVGEMSAGYVVGT